MSIAYATPAAPDAARLPVYKRGYDREAGRDTATLIPGVTGCMNTSHTVHADGRTNHYGSDPRPTRGSTEAATALFVQITSAGARAANPSKVLLACSKCAGTMKRLITQGSYSGRDWELALQTDAATLHAADIPTIVAVAERQRDVRDGDARDARVAYIRANWDEVRARHLAPAKPQDTYTPRALLTSADEFGCVSVVLKNATSSLRPDDAIELGNALIVAAGKAESKTRGAVKP